MALLARELGTVPRRTATLTGPWLDVAPASLDAVYCAEDVFTRHAAEGTLGRCVRTALSALRPGGVLLAAVPSFGGRRPVTSPPRLVNQDGRRELIASVWDWSADGRSYTLDVLRLRRGSGGQWELVDSTATHHRVLEPEDVRAVLGQAGFTGVRVVPPVESGYRVPLWLGVRPAGAPVGP